MIVKFKYNGNDRCCGSFNIDNSSTAIYATPTNHGLGVLLTFANMDHSITNEHFIPYGQDYSFSLDKSGSKSKITIQASLYDLTEEPEGSVMLRGTYVAIVITEEK